MSISLKGRFELAIVFVAPAAVVTAWINEYLLTVVSGGRLVPLLLSGGWLPLHLVAKMVVLGLSAGILIYSKPYEAFLYTRAEDVRHWQRWKRTLGLTCGLVLLECVIRSQAGFTWIRGAGWPGQEPWLPMYIFIISLIVLGATKRLVVFLGRMNR